MVVGGTLTRIGTVPSVQPDDRARGSYDVMDDLTKALATDLDATFPRVVEEMGRKLFWGLRRICGDHQEAEDLTQETFIRAYRALAGYETQRIVEMDLQPWLWTIAMNLGRNHLRSRSRRPTYVAMTGKESDLGAEDPEPVDDTAWDRRLSALNGHQRTAVVLRHVVGMGTSEIAEITGRPEGTVKADVHRGLAKLRQTIEREQ
jgi:RNA polymerase sigma factor (sigma-70 family)